MKLQRKQIKTKNDLIQNPNGTGIHVVLLGAGASLASFPNGDRLGNILPLMDNFTQTLGMQAILKSNGQNPIGNFEDIYSSISDEQLKKNIEQEVHKYFSNLSLPDETTDYDRLLLSLRPKDAIFTFNWDPFLMDAYIRNSGSGIGLPKIFFLHGNVRLFACPIHSDFWHMPANCRCGMRYEPVPLLYPIAEKDYQNSVTYTRESWVEAQKFFSRAFTITIFGYGAPSSDVEAVKLLQNAWFEDSQREMEHIEIIDIADSATLGRRWSAFTPTHHYHIVNSFQESRLWRWPRRSCESLFYPMSKAEVCEDFPFPETNNHDELTSFINDIAKYE